MLNKENYVPWLSRLLRYAKSRPNGKLIHNSILNGPYVRRMILEPGDANRETILLGLPEDIYVVVDSCETAQEIWLRNAGNLTGYNDVQNFGNQNQTGNGNLVVARAEENAAGQNGNQIRNCTVRPRRRDAAYLQTHLLIAQKEEAEIQLQQASTLGTQTDRAPVYDSDGSVEEAAKFVGDFKSLAKEDDESLAKHKALELEIKRLLKAVVSQDIMNIVQKEPVVDTSDLQTKLERTKERFENCIIKKENEYAKLWNDWYKYTRNPLSQKLENENVELEFQVLNYAKENAHLKATYKNLFDSIFVSQTQTKTIVASLQNELQSTIYKNAKLRTQLFKKVSDQKDNTHDTSKNTKFTKQSILGKPPMLDEIHALSKPVTSNSVSTPQEPKVVKNVKVIALGMFRINPDKTSREEKNVPNTVRASNRTKPITVSQPPIFIKKDINSDLNVLSSTGVDNTKTRRTQPRSTTKHDRVPFASKSSRSKNKDAKVEEHHRNLLLSKNNKHISTACNNIKIDSHDVISKVVCAMCKKCLISGNHDVCLRNYVNGKKSRGKKHKAKVFSKKTKRNTAKGYEAKEGNLKLLINFVWKFMGTVRFGNDHVAIILGFGDLQWGNILITRVYFVEGLGHNLFLVGQFCGSDLEVAFRRNACFVRNLEGVALSKDEAPEVIKTFLKRITVLLQSPVIIIRTDNGTKFKNQVLKEFFDTVGISHQMSFVRTPQQNGVVERRNQTLVEAAKTMLIFSRAPLFLWAEAIATNDREDNEMLGAKGDIGFFIGSKPRLQSMTSGYNSSGLDLTYAPSTITTQQPTEGALDLLFEAMYDDYIGGQPSATART
nr:ribonuclease H-like domain-containing protein [Tanacetum cinerariifolium]